MAKVIIKFPYTLRADIRKQKYEELKKQWDNGIMVIDGSTQVIVLKDEDTLMADYLLYTEEKVECEPISNEKTCKNCEFYRNFYGRGQCYGQKDAPYVDDNESCDDFKFKKSCATCKHMNTLIPAEPCFSCIHGLCDENPNRTEKWEAKDDGTNNT